MTNFAGFILIGGKSSRMGEDKFSLKLNGKTFLEIAVENLTKAGIEQISVVDKSEPTALADGLSFITDIYPNRGALSGIHSALVNSKSDWTIILACDYPFVTAELIEFLMKFTETNPEFDSFAPIQSDGKIQPLCAIYKTETCRKVLSKMLENSDKNYSVRDFLNRISTRYIGFEQIANLANAENFFFNVNTPEEFEKAKFLAINVEKMSADDIDEVMKIQLEGNLSYWSFDDYKDEISRENSFSVVAKIDKQVVGFLVARLISEDYCAELYNIGVDLSFRRQKIGNNLLESFTKHCLSNNLEKIYLEVRESNQTAIEFYLKHNFTVFSKRKNFYTNPTEDAILMNKEVLATK
ncbi:MAG: ribosomal protein S18-alanine N-acetyltransferase [Acidobacteriota bacterium]